MELVNERQLPPFIFTFFVFVGIIGISLGYVHLMYPVQSDVNRFYWYMERAAGFTAYELLSLTAILGVSITSTMWDRYKLRQLISRLHQFASLLVFAFIGLHLFGLYNDKSILFTWPKLLLPLQSSYRPMETTFGVLALYLVLILVVTSYYRHRIGAKAWRFIHFLSFPMYFMVTLHGLMTGTDTSSSWAVSLYIVPLVMLLILSIQRFDTVKNHHQSPNNDISIFR